MKKRIIISTLVILMIAIAVIGPKWLVTEKVSDEAKIGVFYYPWYSSGDEGGHKEWLRQVFRTMLDPAQKPALGQYSSQDPEVIGQHIAWSEMGNIDVWVSSWWGPGDYTDITLKDHIMTHQDADKLEYAVLYESQGRLGSFDDPDYTNLLTDMAYLSDNYFNDPNYLRIDGKPVVYFYLTREYFKGDRVEELKKLKEAYPDIYIIGDDLFQVVNGAAKSGLLDAVNNYDVYGQSFQSGDNGASKFELWTLSQIYRMASIAGMIYDFDLIPSVAPSYNDTAVREGHLPVPRYFGNSHKFGELFEAAIQKTAFPYMDQDTGNLIMVTSFNEWYEDTQIEPTSGSAETSSQDSSESGSYYAGGFTYEDYSVKYLEILARLTGN